MFCIPLLIPSYLTLSDSFAPFVKDLCTFGFKKLVILHDYDSEKETLSQHRAQLSAIRERVAPAFRGNGDLRIATNVIVYPDSDFSCYSEQLRIKGSDLAFISVPFRFSREFFFNTMSPALRSKSLKPVFSDFDSNILFMSNRLADDIIHTSGLTFAVDSSFFGNPKSIGTVHRILRADNNLLITLSDYTSSRLVENMRFFRENTPEVLCLKFTYSCYDLARRIF